MVNDEAGEIAGALVILGLVIVQRAWMSRALAPAKVIGVRQMILGFGVVGVTACGTWLA